MPQPAPFTNAQAFVKGAGYKAERSSLGRSVLREFDSAGLRAKSVLCWSKIFIALFGGEEVLFGLVPTHNVPPGFQVIRPLILVEKVIGVLPNVDP